MADRRHGFVGGAVYQGRKDASRQIAEENQNRWDALSPHQKIMALDDRLGLGLGATKQRARLLREIDN